MKGKPTGAKVERSAHLRWVPLGRMRVNPLAQRDLNQARVDKLVAEFDPEQLGTPVVNHRGECFYVIDGQHRFEALKVWLGEGWQSQQVQCEAYEGMSEAEEAEVFLKRNDTLAVHAFAKFRVAVQAGRSDESAIDTIVRRCGLRISQDKRNGAVSAVGTLVRVYRRADPQTLARTLGVIRDAYGDAGLESIVIDGLALLCHRYNGELDDARLGGAPVRRARRGQRPAQQGRGAAQPDRQPEGPLRGRRRGRHLQRRPRRAQAALLVEDRPMTSQPVALSPLAVDGQSITTQAGPVAVAVQRIHASAFRLSIRHGTTDSEVAQLSRVFPDQRSARHAFRVTVALFQSGWTVEQLVDLVAVFAPVETGRV